MSNDDDNNEPAWPPSYYPWPPAFAAECAGQIANEYGLFPAWELNRLGVEGRQIQEALQQGWLERVARGLYRGTKTDHWRYSPIAQVQALRPRAVLCLRDAAMIHGLVPFDDTPAPWFAIGRKRRPIPDLSFEVNWLRWSAARLVLGVKKMAFRGVALRLTTPARTVADFFAHSSRVPNQAMEILHAFRASPFWNERALLDFAELCRVSGRVRTALKEL